MLLPFVVEVGALVFEPKHLSTNRRPIMLVRVPNESSFVMMIASTGQRDRRTQAS